MQVWTFAQARDADGNDYVDAICKSVKETGKSRFGWSSDEDNNLLIDKNYDLSKNSRQRRLRNIKKGDWIVHINTPSYGKCIAGKVELEYNFDDGIKVKNDRVDFRHFFELEKNSIVEFDRNSPNIVPKVNLGPKRRVQRILAVDEFEESIENIKTNKFNSEMLDGKSREIAHLQEKIEKEKYLEDITKCIHSFNKSKKLESFFAKVFRAMPQVDDDDVKETGQVYGTDHGADLLITIKNTLGSKINYPHVIVVQIKSYEGEHCETGAIEQIKTGIDYYKDEYPVISGLLITTAKSTESLEDAVVEANENGYSIDIIAGKDTALFVIENAPHLLFK